MTPEYLSVKDVADKVDYGVTASATELNVGPKFLRITDIQDGAVSWDDVPWCDCGNKDVGRSRLEPGDIVFARTGATTGKSFLIRECPADTVFASYLIRLRLKESFDSRYVAHFFGTPDYWSQITKNARGVAQPGVNATTLKSLRIPVFPLSEQKRITAILDRAEALRAQRRAALALLDELTQSIFLDMFGVHSVPSVLGTNRTVENSNGWNYELLTDVSRLATGHTPDRKNPSYWHGDIPWISLTDIRDLDGTVAHSTGQSVSELGIKHSSSVKLPPGTVCFSRTASIGFVTTMGREMSTSQDFVNWVPGARINSIYLMHALIQSRPHLRGISSGSTHKTIYVRTVEKFRVLVPPIDVQKRFAGIVKRINEQKSALMASSESHDSLFASLQQRAFRGEL